jgi:uncharacterized protein YbjT (DUF2867 family)
MIVITGATGHIGSKLTRLLLERGSAVRAVGREAARLQPLVDLGAEGCIGSLEDTRFLIQAMAGAAAVFAMIPPSYQEPDFTAYQNRIGESLAEAVGKSGVRRVVSLSSLGAHLPAKTGPIMGLRYQEERLNALAEVQVVHLRPTFFMENLMAGIPVMQGMGGNGSALAPDLPVPMIATRDIAAAAAGFLAGVPSGGTEKVRELLGPREYTAAEATAILGRAVGKPGLKYVQFPYEEARKAMTGAGMSPDGAARMIEMVKSMNEGYLMKGHVRTPLNTTPTTLETFAAVFAEAYQA